MNRLKLTSSLIWLSALLLLLLSASSCNKAASPADADQEFNTAYEKYRMLDDRDEKADLMNEFAVGYPDSAMAGRAIGMVVYNRHLVKKDYSGALIYLDERLEVTANPAVIKFIKLQKLEVLAGLGNKEELTSLASELLDSPEGLSGGEKQQLLTSATEAEAWSLAEKVSDKLLEDLKETEDKYALSSVIAKKARAIRNLDRNGDALELFEQAASAAPLNFAGYFEYPVMDLEYQWASALRDAGEFDKALGIFEKRALFVKEETPEMEGFYQDLLRDLYLESGRTENLFEDYKAERKNILSKQVPEFLAPDQSGKMLSFSELKGEKATLLVFWFPT